MTESSQADMPIPSEELVKLRQQLRASVHLLVGYCDGLLDDPTTPRETQQHAALERALTASRQMRSLVNDTLTDEKVQVDRETVAALYESLEGTMDEVVQAMTAILETPTASPLAEYYTSEVRAVRDVAKYLLFADPVGTPPPSSANTAYALPVHAETKLRPQTPIQPDPEAAVERTAQILVAEDEPTTRKALQAHLTHSGYEVVTVENGKLALEAVQQDPMAFDLVLLDLDMPEMDGFEMLEKLKARKATRDIPVIVISGLDDMASVVRCIEQGAEDHLPKPFEQVLLNARVNAALEKKRMRDKEVDYLQKVGRVIDAARAVEAGQYESGALADVGRRADEIGRLSRIFDSMVSGVKERERRLEGQVRELKRDIQTTREMHRAEARSADFPILPTGGVFAERYEIIEELGRGGMGLVYRALDRELDEEVAIKTVRNDLLSIDTSMAERLKTELRLARSISHRNVVRSYDFGEWEGTYYLTMEYVEGVTLRALIDTRGQLGVSSTLAIGKQLADALAVAHERGVIHRDVKPRNLLLDDDGLLKVMDFGIARPSQAADGITIAGTAVGSPMYMAPEQLFGQNVDTRADLYSTGVVLFECLTGEVPVVAPTPLALAAKILEEERVTPSDINPAVPPALSALVLRLLAKQAADRVATAAELAELLQQIH